MKSLFLNFYNTHVQVESTFEDVLTPLKKDFSNFIQLERPAHFDFILQIFNQAPPYSMVPNMVATMQTLNSICYDNDGIRYCDYYGDVLVILDTRTNVAKMYSENISKVHEVSYLLILSRVGKLMDLHGLHKLHAFSVSYKDLAIVCMMPMKGGKSTLLMEFLKDERFKIISDDIPLVNLAGEILPFPIKIGLSDLPGNLNVVNPEVNFYTMDRAHYGKKQLLSLNGLPGRVESTERKFKKVILIEAFRYNSKTSILKDADIFSTGKGLLKHGVIGFGLPMVIEYFWEKGPADFLRKTKIFFLRLLAFSSLLIRAKKMKLFLGKNPHEASEVIVKYVINNYDRI
ncbi:hypothetical protein SHI21_02210 [Bacteriovorax sp. PP10]|uniref:Serine kinase n=1 Tax=Bacteriovorax antarcticus TaxID=3088717 RepID=A0ABU5VPN2_9BACT|nr:hypothetical protein [Bacteriovorax sp. PP10]MEA9354993.1 hypothetical protein [Bacteriovorax sp. PP10]